MKEWVFCVVLVVILAGVFATAFVHDDHKSIRGDWCHSHGFYTTMENSVVTLCADPKTHLVYAVPVK